MSSPDVANTFRAETERAIALVTKYYLDQAQYEFDRQALPEVLAHIRGSLSCRAFAAELPIEVHWDLCPHVPAEEFEPEMTDAEQAAVTLIALAQCRALSELRIILSGDGCTQSSEGSLPDHEFFRCGDRVEIRDPESSFHGHHGEFLFYTDPRVGNAVRQALVQIEHEPLAPISVPPASLAFAPDDIDLEQRYEHIRTWESDDFELRLFDTGQLSVRLGKPLVAYELTDRRFGPISEQVFVGADFAVSPLHAIDSDATAAAVLGFLSLQRGDTGASYFETYSAFQLRWRDERADDLAEWARYLEQRALWRQQYDSGDLLGMVKGIASEGTLDDLCAILELDVLDAYDAIEDLEVDASDIVLRNFVDRVYLAKRRAVAEMADSAPLLPQPISSERLDSFPASFQP